MCREEDRGYFIGPSGKGRSRAIRTRGAWIRSRTGGDCVVGGGKVCIKCVLCEWEGDRDSCIRRGVSDRWNRGRDGRGRSDARGRSVGRSDARGMLVLSWSRWQPSACNLIKLKKWKKRVRDRRPGLCVKMNNEEIQIY